MGKKIFIVGKTLKEARENAGLTQSDLGKEIGVTRVTLTGWEGKEKVEITEEQHKILQRLLNVKSDVLTKVPHGTGRTDEELLNHPLIQSYKREIEALREIIELQKDKIKSLRGDKNQ